LCPLWLKKTLWLKINKIKTRIPLFNPKPLPMTDNILHQTTAIIRGPFELETSQEPDTEAALLAILTERIDEMLEKRPEYLMSLLYRLDVLEEKIGPVMHPAAPEPPSLGLARLVLERQRQRVETKLSVKTEPLKDMDDWVW